MVSGISTDTTAPFSAAEARARSARSYVLVVKPALLLFCVILVTATWITEPGNIPVQLWIACAAFCALQALWVALVLRGFDPPLIAGLSLIADAALEAATLSYSVEPLGSSSTLIFFIVAASYFLSTRLTIAFVVGCTATITLASRLIGDWGGAFPFPSTAFVALITGILCAFIMHRVRGTEQRLEQLAREQRTAREQLEQIDRSRNRLVANVSHELRTPLTSTISSIETLLRDDVALDEPTRARLLLLARDGGLRLLALVEDLLTLGATRPDSLQLAAQPEQLGDIARDAVAGIDPGPGREIRVDVLADPLVRVDRLRLLQVVANLVVNAVRHGAGDVVVKAAVEDGQALLQVTDEGPGIDPEHLDELFLPFARFSTRPDSTGLGLAICRTLVEAHGGTIGYVRDEADRTSFNVRLPVVAPMIHA